MFLLNSCYENGTLIDLSNYHPQISIKNIKEVTDANLNWQTTGIFEPLYIGQIDNIISTNKSYLNDSNFNWRTENLKNFGKPNPKFQIQIDTTSFIYQENFYIDYDSSYESDSIQSKYYKSYPVYILNGDSQKLTIGWGDKIPISKQAKDSLGDWRTIETAFSHFCGTGLKALNLAPKELIVTTTVIYSGEYRTKIRLHYNGNYSNEIEQNINYNQFENVFDETGNYKAEYLIEKENYQNKIR